MKFRISPNVIQAKHRFGIEFKDSLCVIRFGGKFNYVQIQFDSN